MKNKMVAVGCMFTLLSFTATAQTKEIALTIDDLPFVGSADHNDKKLQRKHDRFMQIVDTLKSKQIPATGFIIAGSIEKGQWALLETFRNAGLGLGNHTYTHQSLGSMSAEKYIEDVAKADRILSPVMTEPKFFRYPYLAEGVGEKRMHVHNFLTSLHYRIAPVTIDSKDYRFNEQLYHIPYRSRPAQLPGLIKRYLAYIWSQTLRAEKGSEDKPIKQVLLIHANLLNSHALGELIDMFQKNGYRFVPLTEIVPEAPLPLQSIHGMMQERYVFCRL
ncbi:MAG: polysaccharide deacetylase family protein [Gammaproteobacteria bacterium]|nr:polysaccharide deacetylase family protein [Gammaproteobacteria bacterium]